MSGSSYRHESYTYGNMDYHSTRSWRASSFNVGQYLEARLSTAKWVTRVATRGHPEDNYWVKAYKIQYYNDTGSVWVRINFY